MDITADTKDVSALARWLGPNGLSTVMAVGAMAFFGWFILTQIVEREELILNRLGEVKGSVDKAVQEADRRQQNSLSVMTTWQTDMSVRHREITAWLRAGCYANANGDPDARRYCDEVGRD